MQSSRHALRRGPGYLRGANGLCCRRRLAGCSAGRRGVCDPSSNMVDLDALRNELGPEFSAALDRNDADHAKDCDDLPKYFFCAERSALARSSHRR